MRILAIALGTALLLGCATRAPSEADVVAYAKGLPVTAIDHDLLASQTLGEWIAARAQDGRVAWESNDCGEQTGDPTTTPSDFPICAEAQFTTCTGLSASVSVAVGTLHGGIGGPPELNWAQPGSVQDTDTLSSLAKKAPICRGAPNTSFKPKLLRGSA